MHEGLPCWIDPIGGGVLTFRNVLEDVHKVWDSCVDLVDVGRHIKRGNNPVCEVFCNDSMVCEVSVCGSHVFPTMTVRAWVL